MTQEGLQLQIDEVTCLVLRSAIAKPHAIDFSASVCYHRDRLVNNRKDYAGYTPRLTWIKWSASHSARHDDESCHETDEKFCLKFGLPIHPTVHFK